MVRYCIETAIGVLNQRSIPKAWIRAEGPNMLFLLTNLSRFPDIDVSKDASKLWAKIGPEIASKEEADPGTGATIFQAHKYCNFLSPQEQGKYKKFLGEDVKHWKKSWSTTDVQNMKPFDEKFYRNKWSVYINLITFIWLTSKSFYQKHVEGWGIRVLRDWKLEAPLEKKGVIETGLIYFVTHLIFCSADWGHRALSWTRKDVLVASKVVNYLLDQVKKSKIERNIEPYLELTICKLIFGENTQEEKDYILSFWTKPIPPHMKAKGKRKGLHSRWRRFVGKSWYNAETHIHILVALWLLLDLKITSQVRLSNFFGLYLYRNLGKKFQ